MVLKREPTPPGPITDLFDRLHTLHLHAGEPGVRQIARGIGPGVLSHATVHNVFRGPKVPRWGNLELIVEQLRGDVDAFRSLWLAALHAERAAVPPAGPEPVVLADQLFDFVMVTYKPPIRSKTDSPAGGRWNFRGSAVGDVLCDRVVSHNGVWISGCGPDDARPPAKAGGVSFLSVGMSAAEVEAHYEGYCNSTIWPLYHTTIERPEFQREWHVANQVISRRFAEVVARSAAPGALVWLHDYQLQLTPGYLRRLRPDLRIGNFMHIPFPPPEIFRQLPGRAEVLRGLLGCDLVGFQRPEAVEHFVRLARQVLGLPTSANTIEIDGRTVVADAFPVSIDVKAVERIAARPEIRARARQIRAELGDPAKLLVGIDRLDYTKGIEQRLLAYGEILADGSLPADSVAFIQMGTLTRERVAKYTQLRERVERLAGHLNGKYGRLGSPVVHYSTQGFDFDEIIALYLAADVMVITPLADGMNLVAKEYVASRTDNQGTLVLSEFAGAAAELTEAIIVNPNDVDDLKSGILRAITMPSGEQRQRMEAMRWQLRTHDVHGWISAFLTAVDKAAAHHRG